MSMSKITTAIAVSILLGACQVPEGPPPPPKKVEVIELDSRHAVAFVPGSAAVSEIEASRLERFARPLIADSTATVMVEIPRAVGDPLRHRGITVGEVVGIDLVPDLTHVEVRVRLEGFASQLARADGDSAQMRSVG